MKIERFFHIRTGKKTGGATVRVTADTDQIGQVDVQVSNCSKKDPFCKKTGRTLAAEAPIKVVPLRYLPAELDRIANKAFKRCKTPNMMGMFDYSFAIKYFLPKE